MKCKDYRTDPFYVFLVCGSLILASALGADELSAHLQRAGENNGANYVKLREETLRRSRAALPDLKKAAVNASLTWRQRLVARIWVEWLERSSEIECLRRYDWEKDSGFSPNMLGNRGGAWFGIMPFIIKRFKEHRFWYYYCEAALLRTEERWPVAQGFDWLPKHWGGAAWGALKNEPEFYYCVADMRETLCRDVELKSELAQKVYSSLLIQGIPDTIPELLASYLKSCQLAEDRFGPSFKSGRISLLRGLIRKAGSQHVGLFDGFIAANPEFSRLKPEVDRLRSKPPVKEWEEPAYNPGHESESLKAADQKP